MSENQPENTPAQETNQAIDQPEIKSEQNQANWKAFREQKEADRKARIEAERMAAQKAEEAAALRSALEAAVSRAPQQSHHEQDEGEEARMERRIKEIILEREKEYMKQHEEEEKKQFPSKLRTVYKDFDKVCSSENLDYLEFHYPEVAAPFKYMPEGFEKWASVYQALKRFIPNADNKGEAARVDKNLAKPSSLSSVGNAHGTTGAPGAYRLTEERKAANRERMDRILKSAG